MAPTRDTQPRKWIIAGDHRFDEVWNGDKNCWFKLSHIKNRAAANADNYMNLPSAVESASARRR